MASATVAQLTLPVQWAALDAHTIYLHLTLHRAVDKTLLRGRRGAARGAAPSDSIQTRSRRPCPRERGEQVDPSGLSVRGGGLSPHPADRCTQPHAGFVLLPAWTPGGWRGRSSAGIPHLPNRGLSRRPARSQSTLSKTLQPCSRALHGRCCSSAVMGVHAPNSSVPPTFHVLVPKVGDRHLVDCAVKSKMSIVKLARGCP